jgi:hypothetical protein
MASHYNKKAFQGASADSRSSVAQCLRNTVAFMYESAWLCCTRFQCETIEMFLIVQKLQKLQLYLSQCTEAHKDNGGLRVLAEKWRGGETVITSTRAQGEGEKA